MSGNSKNSSLTINNTGCKIINVFHLGNEEIRMMIRAEDGIMENLTISMEEIQSIYSLLDIDEKKQQANQPVAYSELTQPQMPTFYTQVSLVTSNNSGK